MESTGVKLGRDKSRRRLPHEKPRFNENGERVLRGQQSPGSDDEETSAKVRVTQIRRSKSLHAKATGGGNTPDGERERTLLLWHSGKSQRKKRETERSNGVEILKPTNGGTSTESSVFKPNSHGSSEPPIAGPDARSGNRNGNDNFIQRLVSVIGDISCPVHPDRSIQSCPRECGWHIEHHVERGKFSTDDVEGSLLSRSNSITLVSSSSPTVSIHRGSHEATEKRTQQKRYLFGLRPCYILIFLGVLSIAGSLAPAIWRTNAQGDLSGGFTLAQYILGVGIFVVGSMVAIHSRTCVCWHNDSS